ncbi:zinc-binding dehydrogenase [Arsenicicoccus dermatophilus]|uniref:zinc-binding dehydrogenase n=1 Tax=Arsenicicoccus dermatophilus TaxID=1076331 RepID=UPI001F4D103A|nr:zinc-binding dehydrogenase [Arsenicicoccus dermatophilus]MCH8613614.1 zinc-binding dehydrogenase [Arsenicicoccus dermatophilus]
MLAAYAARASSDDPLSALEVGEQPEPQERPGWVTVTLRTSGLNHHDLWSLKGVGLPPERLPMVLGCDGAGVTPDGDEVIVHAVVASEGWRGDETLDPRRTLLSELHPGTIAERVAVPAHNLVPKPAELPWEHAACLSTAWLTAYRMLFTNAGVQPGATVLVQGAGGGVATALVQLGAAAGLRVWATSRDEAKRQKALELGAAEVFESGARLPHRVDAVLDTVGAAVWRHSIKSLEAGGTLVTAGATTGDPQRTELADIFFRQLRVVGSTMGNRVELERLARFVVDRRIEPAVDGTTPLPQARRGFERLAGADLFGKVIITH